MPRRELNDPRQLRALAHPVRLSLMEAIGLRGPSTATELSEHLGTESPANCSWHLRQLAQYGFIEEAESGPGRQRRWRIIPESTTVRGEPDHPELAVAADAFDEVLLERALAKRRAWMSRRLNEPAEWREAAFSSHSWFWLTAEELSKFQSDYLKLLDDLVERTIDRLDPARRPEGSRAVQLMGWVTPVGSEHVGTQGEGEAR